MLRYLGCGGLGLLLLVIAGVGCSATHVGAAPYQTGWYYPYYPWYWGGLYSRYSWNNTHYIEYHGGYTRSGTLASGYSYDPTNNVVLTRSGQPVYPNPRGLNDIKPQANAPNPRSLSGGSPAYQAAAGSCSGQNNCTGGGNAVGNKSSGGSSSGSSSSGSGNSSACSGQSNCTGAGGAGVLVAPGAQRLDQVALIAGADHHPVQIRRPDRLFAHTAHPSRVKGIRHQASGVSACRRLMAWSRPRRGRSASTGRMVCSGQSHHHSTNWNCSACCRRCWSRRCRWNCRRHCYRWSRRPCRRSWSRR